MCILISIIMQWCQIVPAVSKCSRALISENKYLYNLSRREIQKIEFNKLYYPLANQHSNSYNTPAWSVLYRIRRIKRTVHIKSYEKTYFIKFV